jgi:hypothetical protein
MASDWWRGEAVADLDLAERERDYRSETGDKPWFVGFETRFQEWCTIQTGADPGILTCQDSLTEGEASDG